MGASIILGGAAERYLLSFIISYVHCEIVHFSLSRLGHISRSPQAVHLGLRAVQT